MKERTAIAIEQFASETLSAMRTIESHGVLFKANLERLHRTHGELLDALANEELTGNEPAATKGVGNEN